MVSGHRFATRALVFFCLITLAPFASAAEDTLPTEAADGETIDPSQPAQPADPYNRGTPRTATYGYIAACRGGDFERAAHYLDLRRLPPGRQSEGPDLARMLKVVLDRTFWIEWNALSGDSAGHRDDGLPPQRDLLARIETRRGSAELTLQRVPRRSDGVPIWKVSAATVERIPDLYDEFGYGPLLRWLPAPFFEIQLLALQLWQWVGLLVVVFLAWIVSWLVSSAVVRLLSRVFMRTRTDVDDRILAVVSGPVRLALGVGLFAAGTLPLGLSVGARDWLGGAEQALLVVAVTWLLLRLIDLLSAIVEERMIARGQAASTSFLGLGRKTAKAIVIALAGVALLDNLGFNVTALIAGLGVGGIAVALAAQKTIENLFGGITLFADQPVAVGDFCRFGEKVGTVEAIGLRSTRVRTLDRTLVSVPNADFSTLQLENFAARDRMRLFAMIGLRYETSAEQLRWVLAKLREMLLAHPRITDDPARVRFVGFGAYSLDLELFAYVDTSNWSEFLQIREDVYLRIMDIVAESGTGFAFPSQTLYLGRDEGLSAERGASAVRQVAGWREEGVLPFPEFALEQRQRVWNTLDWPPRGSPDAPPTAGPEPSPDDARR